MTLPASIERFATSPPSHLRVGKDVAGFDLGVPAAWLAPRTTQDVRETVLAARSTQTKVVPVGHGSAYWRPLDLRDAYALDLRGLNWATLPSEASFASFGAGTLELRVRADHLKVELESALHGISLQVEEMDSAMPLSRFRGPVDGLEHLFRTEHSAAVDVIVPYPALADCLAAAETVMAEARELGAHARTAFYLAPGFEELIRAISTVMDPDGILTGGTSSIA